MVFKLLIITVMVVLVVLFLVPETDGTKDIVIEDVIEAVVEDLQKSVSAILPESVRNFQSPPLTKVYKWKDKDGVWQFSNVPVDEPGAEMIEINSQINTIPAFETPEPDFEDVKD